MRYDKRITLHKTNGRQYNPDTGKTELVIDEGVTLPCNVSAVSLEQSEAVFGSYERKVATARLQQRYDDVADKAVIGTQKYDILRHVPHRKESVFYLEGVSEWT